MSRMSRTLPGSAQALRGGRLPDFLLVGAPKAGTTALHAALAQHPELFLSGVKEPKYYLCGDSPPPAYRGPGDAHSNQEWIWQRQRYLDLFADAGEDQLAGESTPLYLYHRDARRRIASDLPRARLVAVLRDPVDRAYSNWMHLWADGLEPCADVVEACNLEAKRVDDGWAPFWHYRGLGMYGRQLADLFEHFPAEQVLVLRYRSLVDDPRTALDRVCRFLGVSEDVVTEIPKGNSKPFVHPSARTKLLGRWCGPVRPWASSCHPGPGGSRASRWSASCTSAATPSGPGSPRSRGRSCGRRSSTTSTCWRPSRASRSTTGVRTVRAARSTPVSPSASPADPPTDGPARGCRRFLAVSRFR
jgi:hypothetical protein